MVELNIPTQDIDVKIIESKNYIFDLIRKKYLILTPEEWVRQNLVRYFINDLNYPKGLIKTESSLKYNNLNRLFFNFSKNVNFSSSSLAKIFRSIKPTVEAFCGKKFNAFHSLLI